MMRSDPPCSLLCICLAICGCHSERGTQEALPETRAVSPRKSAIESSFFLRHDFGVVDRNKRLHASLKLKNTGQKPLTFAFSKASCGCMSVKSMPETIPSGETGSFDIELDTSRLAGRRNYNLLAWDAEPMTIVMKAHITALVRSVTADPAAVNFGELLLTEESQKSFFVVASGYPDAEIISAETDATWISLERQHATTSKDSHEQGIRAIGRYRVKWTGQEAGPGNLRSRIIIKVKGDANTEETLVVPVSCFLKGKLDIVPSQIVFGQICASKPVVRTCSLTFNAPEPDVSGIVCESEHAFVEASLDVDSECPSRWKLTVRAALPEAVKGDTIQGTLVGKGRNGETVFSIPYMAFTKTVDSR